MEVYLIRTSMTEKAVYGFLVVHDGLAVRYTCVTIERLDRIFPAGTYDLRLEPSPKFNNDLLWELYGIPGRHEIKIHIANYWEELDGCVGIGMRFGDINSDGVIDATNSKTALTGFKFAMQSKGQIVSSKIHVFDNYT